MKEKNRTPLLLLIATLCALSVSNLTLATSANINRHRLFTEKTGDVSNLDTMPLYFEPFAGNVNKTTEYHAHGRNHSFVLSTDGLEITLGKEDAVDASGHATVSALKMGLVGGRSQIQPRGKDQMLGRVNYYHGKDSSQWRLNIPTYGKVAYESVYPGINLVYYGNENELEYDFIVEPGADPKNIRFAVQSIGNTASLQTSLTRDGDLVIRLGEEEIRWRSPSIYQETRGQHQDIQGRFVLFENNQVGFDIANYDTTQPLVIDPVLAYSSYFGGSGNDRGNSITTDSTGNIYITGSVWSVDLPTTANAFRTTAAVSDTPDAFVSKFSPAGQLIYSTYLGSTGNDEGWDIAVDGQSNIFVVGTASEPFPLTSNAAIPFQNGRFIARINSIGELTYSSGLGGDGADLTFNTPSSIAVDDAGNFYVTGTVSSLGVLNVGTTVTSGKFNGGQFPITADAYDSTISRGSDCFVTRFNSAGLITYSTFLGSQDKLNNQHVSGCNAIAVDKNGNFYVTGETQDEDFPLTSDAIKSQLSGELDMFIARFNPAGQITYSSYFGGFSHNEVSHDIAVDGDGNFYITGQTESFDFPVTPIRPDPTSNGASQAFVTKFNAAGQIVYSGYLSGTVGESEGRGIGVDSAGNAYVAGNHLGIDFPTTPDAPYPAGGSFQIGSNVYPSGGPFIVRIDPAGQLLYATYLGILYYPGGTYLPYGDVTSIAVDRNNNAFVTGVIRNFGLLTTQNALAPISKGRNDAFLIKVGLAGTQPLGVECLFNWAEQNYPALFAPSASTGVWFPYTYRYYSATNAYLGISSIDNHVYYMGPDGQLQDEGPLPNWLPLAGCQ